jgi:chemotaxis protein MotB
VAYKKRKKDLLNALPQVDMEIGENPLWLIVLSDMMTNLMVFFLLIFAITRFQAVSRNKDFNKNVEESFSGTADSSSKSAATKAEQMTSEKEVQLAAKMKEHLSDKGMGTDAEVRINEQKIRIMLSSPILFDSGRSELKTSSYPIMHEVAALIKDIPNRIVIEGHTDNQPVNTSEFKSNWELSAARAFSVVRYFIEKEKLDPERLAGLGYGEYRPLLANDSEDNRSKNRRVEVNIIRVAH